MDWNLTYTKKNGNDNYNYENGFDKKIIGLSKLKLWTFFWGQGEHEWPLYVWDTFLLVLENIISILTNIILILLVPFLSWLVFSLFGLPYSLTWFSLCRVCNSARDAFLALNRCEEEK